MSSIAAVTKSLFNYLIDLFVSFSRRLVTKTFPLHVKRQTNKQDGWIHLNTTPSRPWGLLYKPGFTTGWMLIKEQL